MRKAVVVGIDDYPGEADDLPSCVADARWASELLRGPLEFSSVTELHDGDATHEAVTGALSQMLAGAQHDDRLVFYYSGHGSQIVKHDELREALCLHDRLLYDDVLVEASAQLPPGVLTVVLDSCFSGGMSKHLARTAKIKARTLIQKDAVSPSSYRAFGVGSRLQRGPLIAAKTTLVVNKLAEESGPRLNGLLVSACLENETAAASTSATEGLSAFTFALKRAIEDLGVGVPVADLMTRAGTILRAIDIVQSPQIHPPASPAMHEGPLFLGLRDAVLVDRPNEDGLLEHIARLTAKAVLALHR